MKLNKRHQDMLDIIRQARRGLIVVGKPSAVIQRLIEARPRLVIARPALAIKGATLHKSLRVTLSTRGEAAAPVPF